MQEPSASQTDGWASSIQSASSHNVVAPPLQHGQHPMQVSPFLLAQQDCLDQQQQQQQPQPELPKLQIRTHPHLHHSAATSRDVEMSSRRHHVSTYVDPTTGEVRWDDLETSSDEADDVYAATEVPGTPPGVWAAGVGAFEPFAVEERSTEVKYLRDMYSKKERECEHLRQIIKELSQSRAKVQKTKVELEEQFVGLQKEYYRVNKVSELARTVSQQAVARSAALRSELSAAQDQARRSRRRAAAAEARAAGLAEENVQLKQQMALLEQLRLSHEDFRTSACAREYLFSHSVSLY